MFAHNFKDTIEQNSNNLKNSYHDIFGWLIFVNALIVIMVILFISKNILLIELLSQNEKICIYYLINLFILVMSLHLAILSKTHFYLLPKDFFNAITILLLSSLISAIFYVLDHELLLSCFYLANYIAIFFIILPPIFILFLFYLLHKNFSVYLFSSFINMLIYISILFFIFKILDLLII